MSPKATGIRLLGGLSIGGEDDPSAAAFPGRRAELVFAYLVAEHRRDVTRDELANALWPEELPDAWAAALRGVVSDVRRVLEAEGFDAGELLRRTGSGYRLALPTGTVVDLDEARWAIARARSLIDDDPAAAAPAATRAGDLAQLPFLPRHESEWVEGVRRELEVILVEALELAARAHARTGDARAAAAAAARLVEAEPFSEAAHRLRIGILVETGDRSGAMRAYEHCRSILLEELGVEPSAETRSLLPRPEDGPPAAPEPAVPPMASTASPFGSMTVLVVDDHDFQRRTALALLGRLGVGTLTEARDGAEALELLAASEPPDVIVCDIDMPGMDGVEFIRHVAERRLASAVAIASGLDRGVLRAVEAVGEGYGLTVLGAVEKPLTVKSLSELLAAYRRPAPSRPTGRRIAVSEGELRAAIDAGRIGVRYAPIVDLQNGGVSGARVLPTWREASGATPCITSERVSTAVATQLTERVLELACDQLRELGETGAGMSLWIAIAPGALTDVDHADRLLEIVRERDAESRRIVCTIEERAVRRSTAAELEVLTRLRVKGFGVCLDDFGSGQHPDDVVARLPLTAVALPPELVGGATRDPAREAALDDAVEAARALGLPVAARGCDDPEDYELLMQVGCRGVEGEFISAPLTAAELAPWTLDWQAPAFEARR